MAGSASAGFDWLCIIALRASTAFLISGSTISIFDFARSPTAVCWAFCRSRDWTIRSLTISNAGGCFVRLILEFHEMPAELRLHRIGNFALLQLEDNFFELRHHLPVAEVTEVAAIVLGARIFRIFFGEFSEIGALSRAFPSKPWLRLQWRQEYAAPILPPLASKA